MKLKPSVIIQDLENIQINGYFVRCTVVTQIEHIVLRTPEDAPKDASNGSSYLLLVLRPQQEACLVKYPTPFGGSSSYKIHMHIINQGGSLFIFPIDVSQAVTTHKLQGQTIKDLLVSGCHYPDTYYDFIQSSIRPTICSWVIAMKGHSQASSCTLGAID